MEMNELTKKDKWDYTKAIPIHRFSEMTVGVIGLGRIGRNFAEKMHSIGFHVIGFDPYYKPTSETKKYVSAVSMDELIVKSDIISIHCPAEENQNLIGAAAFKKMKNSAVLINVARGGIVNEADLKQALENGDSRRGVGLYDWRAGKQGFSAIWTEKSDCNTAYGMVFRRSAKGTEKKGSTGGSTLCKRRTDSLSCKIS